MYTISVGNVQAQSIDANGKPTGTPQKIEFEAKGTTGCHLDADPKAQSFDVWVQGGVDNTGKLRAEGEQKQTGANDQITACARSVLINNPIHVAPGGYRVTAKVSFKPSKG